MLDDQGQTQLQLHGDHLRCRRQGFDIRKQLTERFLIELFVSLLQPLDSFFTKRNLFGLF